MIPIMGLLGGFGGKIVIILAAAAAMATAVMIWRADIKQAVYNEFYAAEVEEALKKERDEVARLNDIISLRETKIADLQKATEATEKKLDQIEAKIRSGKLADAVAAQVLKVTIDDLRKIDLERRNANAPR